MKDIFSLITEVPSARATNDIRRPSQKRSRERFEAILDATEALLETLDPPAISVHRLAAELDMSAASIYHFFPEPALVFVALAERYLQGFEDRAERALRIEFDTWQDLQTHDFQAGREFFNSNAPARKVLLGPPASFDIRARDLQSDVVMARRGIERMGQLFVLPDRPDMLERTIEVIVINDALWALSFYRHGTITLEMEEQARRARIAYSCTYLPEYLPRRSVLEGTR